MFTSIFKFELRYWLRQPIVYVFAVFFFGMSFTTMWGMSSEASATSTRGIMNSAWQIHRMSSLYSLLILALLPTIIGFSVFRDFSNNVHPLLYSFSFKKRDYIFGKFLSSLVVVVGILGMLVLGFFLGTLMPGVDPGNINPFNLWSYLQTYLIFLVPNVFLFGAIVFAVVLLSRNIYAGFITVFILIILQGIIKGWLSGMDQDYLAGVLDPLGDKSVAYYTKYWTKSEKNTMLLPFAEVVILNRAFWSVVATLVFSLAFKGFDFNQQGYSFFKTKFSPKDNWELDFKTITTVDLPTVKFDFSNSQYLKTAWSLSNEHFKFVMTSWPFIIVLFAGFSLVFFQQIQMNPEYGFELLPLTWRMLSIPTFLFGGVINLLTFLYAGVLVHRERLARMNQLVDITPVPNWVFLLSKFMAVLKMQLVLLSFIFIAGILVQTYKGYYNFEVVHYLYELLVINWIHFIIWAMMAVFIHTLIPNLYLAIFVLFLLPIISITIAQVDDYLGIYFFKNALIRFNQIPGQGMGFEYSDLDGYNRGLRIYLLFKTYWLLGGAVALSVALLLWVRGLPISFAERIQIARSRWNGPLKWTSILLLITFLSLGFGIHYEERIVGNSFNSSRGETEWVTQNEKKYKQYEYTIQPRLAAIRLAFDLEPTTKDFNCEGKYLLVNKTNQPIDTLLLGYSYREETDYEFDRSVNLLNRDTFNLYDLLLLDQPLVKGDTLVMTFKMKNQPIRYFQPETRVLNNGSYIRRSIFPTFGYRTVEHRNNKTRIKQGLLPKDHFIPFPEDSLSLGYEYGGNKNYWIDFEAILSTTDNQSALAPGVLQREWTENGRHYFHYKTEKKIEWAYALNFGFYEIARDQWNDIPLEIHHHPDHDHTLQSLFAGMKGSLAYCSKWFSPYPFKDLRIVEYAKSEGTHATAMANCMPYSELFFTADLSDESADAIDFPYFVSAHEVAHTWWGNLVNPSNTLGSKMLTESMAEYVALKVMEHDLGKKKMRKFLKMDLDRYLKGRSNDRRKEMPLQYGELNQDYINYNKGALIFYALSDYVGEERLNGALAAIERKHRYGEAPFATSLEMVKEIEKILPDSLAYLKKDMFETITLYDNQVEGAKVVKLPDGKYQVDFDIIVSKYRSGTKGKAIYSDNGVDSLAYTSTKDQNVFSLPLQDYIDVGVFDAQGEVLYFKRHLIRQMDNHLSILLDQEPAEVGIDPFNKLIDRISYDNRLKL